MSDDYTWGRDWDDVCRIGTNDCVATHEWGVRYRHVKNLDEAMDAMAAGTTVRDRDADIVLDIDPQGIEEFGYTYKRMRTGVVRSVSGLHNDDFDRFLVPVYPTAKPVTEEELAEVARSIARAKGAR